VAERKTPSGTIIDEREEEETDLGVPGLASSMLLFNSECEFSDEKHRVRGGERTANKEKQPREKAKNLVPTRFSAFGITFRV